MSIIKQHIKNKTSSKRLLYIVPLPIMYKGTDIGAETNAKIDIKS